jgi:hypothetical protein
MMTTTRIMKWFVFAICFALINSCKSDIAKYDELVNTELGRGVRKDSLFMGVKLGMKKKEFYTHCWDMNKKGLFIDGTNSMSVLYKMKKELKHPASMNFFPDFADDKIYRMRVTYSYDAFAPWNKNLMADSLQADVINLCKKWYQGNDFITVTDSLKGTIHVKVDGNRRIVVGKFNEAQVKVIYTDLLAEKKLVK